MTRTKNTKLRNRIRHLCYISLVEAIISVVAMITTGCILTFSAVAGHLHIVAFMVAMFGVAIGIIVILWAIVVHMSNQMIKLYDRAKAPTASRPQPCVPAVPAPPLRQPVPPAPPLPRATSRAASSASAPTYRELRHRRRPLS